MSATAFTSLDEFNAILQDLPQPDSDAQAAATARNGQLTKPPGALGRLEELAIWYAGWRGDAAPKIQRPQVVVFAGNHGICAQGISAFPPEVTEQMVYNFQAGGAAINQLSDCFGATLTVKSLDLDHPTKDFTTAAAMSEEALVKALNTGWHAVDERTDLLVTGEMGIGNTTAAAAIAMALFGGEVGDWVGRGTGVDDAGLARKSKVVGDGIALHAAVLDAPLDVLRCLGGREIAAMAGAITRARMLGIPVILDGFICTSAAAVLAKVNPQALDHCVAGHVSAEGAHQTMLDQLGLVPLLSLGLRLGEGSGGALAIGILQGALACHSGMATFAEAGVADS